MENLKEDVQSKFAEIRNALHMREKLLLRQADVIMQQTKQQQLGRGSSLFSSSMEETREVKFLSESENELLTAIRNFGRFQLDNINLTLQDVYLRNEDYITPSNDHETMYKCLQQTQTELGESNELELLNKDNNYNQPEAIVVDFSRNKSLIENNAKHMNKSIINITLQEAKELIKKARMRREWPIPPLNLEELDDELESSIAEAVSSLGHDAASTQKTQSSNNDEQQKSTKYAKKFSSNRFKPKITINNCNGTINLRNISNLTINCATEDSISAQIPLQQSQHQQNVTATAPRSPPELVPSNRDSESSSNTNSTQKSATIIDAIMSSSDDSPTPTPTTTASNSNHSSSSSSRSQSQKQPKNSTNKKAQSTQGRTSSYPPYGMAATDYDDGDDDDEDDGDDERENMESHAITCDFYNRLLKEIKNSLRTKRTTNDNIRNSTKVFDQEDNNKTLAASNVRNDNESNSNTSSNVSFVWPPTSHSTATTTASQSGAGGRRLVLKNFENLRIVLEANSSDEESFHPVQIEQWLAEIISETDLEPMQNTDILEHSKIHNSST